MEITRTSMFSGVTRTLDLDITIEQMTAWHNGTLIQEAMPHLSQEDREFIVTGVTQEEWAKMFSEEEA